MRIVAIRKVEDCFDGSTIYAYGFECPWTREDILQLNGLGQLDFFEDFPRPFFRVLVEGGCQVKGVEGEDNCLAIYPETRKLETKQQVEEFLGSAVDAGADADETTKEEGGKPWAVSC